MKKYWRYANRWLLQIPARALDAAYNAVLRIKKIEDEYFSGQQIILPSDYSESVVDYLQFELSKCLRIAQAKLSEFKISSFILNLSPIDSSYSSKILDPSQSQQESQTDAGQTIEVKAVTYETLEKLKLIDETFAKYNNFNLKNRTHINSSLHKTTFLGNTTLGKLNEEVTPGKTKALQNKSNKLISEKRPKSRSSLEKTGFIPRSIGRTLGKIKRDLDPNAELKVIEEFRSSRYLTVASIRYLLILILVPLLVNQLSSAFVIKPLIENFWSNKQSEIFLNSSQSERALAEIKTFENKIRFDFLIGKPLELSLEARDKKLKEKATELAHQYRTESADAIKNVFTDILTVVTFLALVVTGQRQVATLKSFISELIYGLSDSAKASLIILFTNMFVGFHSTHG